MIIGFFGTQDDRPYAARFNELIGVHQVKSQLSPVEMLAAISARVKANKLDAIITTCPTTMLTLLKSQLDFKHPRDKRGTLKKLAVDDYAGSCFIIPGSKLGVDHDVRVLILNPLQNLVRTPEGYFLFKRYISKVTKPESWYPQTNFTWEIWTPQTSSSLLVKFSTARLLSCDIETYVGDDLRRIHCVGYCALFPDGSTHSVVVPFKDMLAHLFVRNLNATSVPKIFQNGLYDNAYFLRWNCPVTNYLYDTLHFFHSWYSELPKRLDFITAFAVRDIRFWKDDAHGGSEFDMFEYNARDCWATLTAMCSLLLEAPEWATTNYLMEFPLVFPCLMMECDGLSLDKAVFDTKMAETQASLAPEAAKLAAWFGPNFNPASPVQCIRLLKVLGMGDVDSADSKTMIACASLHPLNEVIISTIISYRKKMKLLSTYFKWDKFWNGRLHGKTNPAGTDTGRMAATESSFWTGLQYQNIPGGSAIKSWIVVDEGWLLAEADFAQSDARGVGYLSGCKSLIDLVESDKDYHTWNAHTFFGVPYEEISKALRNLAKRVNHGANFNMGANVMLETMGPRMVAEAKVMLKLPARYTLVQVCQHLLNTYSNTYPEVKHDWYEALKRTVKLSHRLVSPLGWTRYFFADPTSSKPALNLTVAHGPQNLTAGVLNKVFYRIWLDSMYGDLKGKVRFKAQIHDSILFEYKGEGTPELVRSRMGVAIPVTGADNVTRSMLIPADINYGGKSWAELK